MGEFKRSYLSIKKWWIIDRPMRQCWSFQPKLIVFYNSSSAYNYTILILWKFSSLSFAKNFLSSTTSQKFHIAQKNFKLTGYYRLYLSESLTFIFPAVWKIFPPPQQQSNFKLPTTCTFVSDPLYSLTATLTPLRKLWSHFRSLGGI